MVEPLISLFTAALCVVTSISLGYFLFLVRFLAEKLWKKETYPPAMGTMIDEARNFSRLYDYHTELSAQHKTFRILYPSAAYLYTCDPANIEHVLKTKFSIYQKGDSNSEMMKDFLGDGIFNVDGDAWRHQRKLASVEFSRRAIMNFSSDVFREKAEELVEHLSNAANTGKAIDMQDLLMRATLESIFTIGFGVELTTFTGSSEEAIMFANAFNDSNALVYKRYIDVFWKLKRFLNIGSEAALKKNINLIDNILFKIIQYKREQHESTSEQNAKKNDILSRFLEASKQDPESITDKILRDIVLNFMIAGRDTTAVTLSWLLYMMCKNPSVADKIEEEVKNVIENVHETNGKFTDALTSDTLDRMHYLHAALAETLRLYPAVPMDFKGCTDDDTLPDGCRVRKGDDVLFPIYSMGRMTYLWGDDANEYRPERWIEGGVFRPESPFKFTAFLAGPRICLGKEFAYQQMKIIAATLIYFFKFELEEERGEVTYRTMFTLHIDQGLHLRVYRKESTT